MSELQPRGDTFVFAGAHIYCRNSRGQHGVSPSINFCNTEECCGMTTVHAETRRRRRRPGAGRPSKGDRRGTYALLPNQKVHKWVQQVAKAYNDAPLSQVIADLVSIHAGYDEFVRDLNAGNLALVLDVELPDDDSSSEQQDGDPVVGLADADSGEVEIFTRLPEKVWEWVCDMADAYDASLKQVVGDVVSIAAGEPELVRKLNKQSTKEALPLAI